MKYIMSIVQAQYPAIDPNITHQYSDLAMSDYEFVKIGDLSYEDECFIHHGTVVPMSMRVIDRIQIKEDYNLPAVPVCISKSLEKCVFALPDNTIIEIDSDTIKKQYFCHQSTDVIVVSTTARHALDVDDEFMKALEELFCKEKQRMIKFNTYYKLSVEMAYVIQKYSKLNLYHYFSPEEVPIYIKIKKT